MSSDTKNSTPEEQPLEEKTIKKESFEKRNYLEKLWLIKSNISVEPILAGLIIPSMLARLAIQNLNLDKACRVRLNYTDEICDSLIARTGNLTLYEGEVQKVISNIETWKSVIQTALPTIYVIFMGAWSDRTGNRKLCILLPIFGEFLVCISNILSTYFFYEISIEITMLLEALCPALTGGLVLVYLGVFSYISDITDEESRTFRVGLVNLCMTAGIPIGTALSGILLKIWGYYGIFLLSGTIYLVTFTYGCIYLKSKTKPGIENSGKTHGGLSSDPSPIWGKRPMPSSGILQAEAYENIQGNKKELKYICQPLLITPHLNELESISRRQETTNGKAVTFSDLFTLVKETVVVAFKKRDGNMRKKIILSLSVVAIIYGPNHGERIITYMFVRYRLKWDALKYSIYSTYSIITHSIGALFSISVFSKHWGFHDSMLCLISITSKLIGSVYIAFVKSDFEMFMVPIIEILNATTFTSLRSMVSKLVLPEEMGKINSLFSLVETLAALMFDPTYSALYSRTIPIFTGAVYIFSAIMTLPPIAVLLWLFAQHRRETKLRKREAMDEQIVCFEAAENTK